ncbi:unnamed protein product, partial [Closterium sp. NIES-53]
MGKWAWLGEGVCVDLVQAHLDRTVLHNQLSPCVLLLVSPLQADLVQAHLDRTALTRLPRRYQSILKQADSSETPDMIPTPDLDTFVFCVATRPLPSVQLDPEQDDIIGMAPGELHILRYRPIQTL